MPNKRSCSFFSRKNGILKKLFFKLVTALYNVLHTVKCQVKKEKSGAASFDPTVWEIRSESKEGKLVPPPQCLSFSRRPDYCCRCVGVLVRCAPVWSVFTVWAEGRRAGRQGLVLPSSGSSLRKGGGPRWALPSHELRLLHRVLVRAGVPRGVARDVWARCADGGFNASGWAPRSYGGWTRAQSAAIGQCAGVYASSALLH